LDGFQCHAFKRARTKLVVPANAIAPAIFQPCAGRAKMVCRSVKMKKALTTGTNGICECVSSLRISARRLLIKSHGKTAGRMHVSKQPVPRKYACRVLAKRGRTVWSLLTAGFMAISPSHDLHSGFLHFRMQARLQHRLSSIAGPCLISFSLALCFIPVQCRQIFRMIESFVLPKLVCQCETSSDFPLCGDCGAFHGVSVVRFNAISKIPNPGLWCRDCYAINGRTTSVFRA
jgi:hypothetical protein